MKETTDEINDGLIKEWGQLISGFIDKLEEESPYSDLHDAERGILIDMQNFIEIGDKDALKRKVSELAKIIHVRTSDMNQMVESNKRATFYAKIGVALTILFGIISLVLAFDQLFN
jgi:hypothetical protein